jgi:hypothetical protein
LAFRDHRGMIQKQNTDTQIQKNQFGQCPINPNFRRTRSHGKKRMRVGNQKQGLPGIGREVSGSGDVIDNLQKKQTYTRDVSTSSTSAEQNLP